MKHCIPAVQNCHAVPGIQCFQQEVSDWFVRWLAGRKSQQWPHSFRAFDMHNKKEPQTFPESFENDWNHDLPCLFDVKYAKLKLFNHIPGHMHFSI